MAAFLCAGRFDGYISIVFWFLLLFHIAIHMPNNLVLLWYPQTFRNTCLIPLLYYSRRHSRPVPSLHNCKFLRNCMFLQTINYFKDLLRSILDSRSGTINSSLLYCRYKRLGNPWFTLVRYTKHSFFSISDIMHSSIEKCIVNVCCSMHDDFFPAASWTSTFYLNITKPP